MIVLIKDTKRKITGLKKVKYPRICVTTGDQVDLIEYAEYYIIGNNKKWMDWTPLDKFMEDNPGVI